MAEEDQVVHGLPAGYLIVDAYVRVGGALAVDTRYLQFFDPASGLSIGHPLAAVELAEQ